MHSDHDPLQRDDRTPTEIDEASTRPLAAPIPIDRHRAYSAMPHPPTRVDLAADSEPFVPEPYPFTDEVTETPSAAPSPWPPTRQESWGTPPQSLRPARPATGVRIGPFLGAVGVTTVIAGLLVGLLSWVMAAVVDVVPLSYWDSESVPAPVIEGDLYIGWAVAANLAAAGLLFVLIKLGIAPVGRWFSLLTRLLAGVAIVWWIGAGGPWQHWLPAAVVIAVTGLAIAAWGRGYGRATTLNIHDF